MAFIRRGNVRVPHKASAFILLHRFDDVPVKFKLDDIQCWEEHKHKMLNPVCLVYHHLASSTAVRESFDEIDAEINGKAVTS